MKKIFLMLLGIVATINAMAVDYTAQAMITITSSTGYYNSMIVQEAAIYGNSIVGAEMNLEGNGAFLYGINGSTKLQVVRGADLEGVQLGVKTDAGTEFTFTVSSVEGSNPLYFMDAQGDNHLLENDASFVISDLAANSTIENRFSLGRPSAPVYAAEVTTNAYGWATFSYDQDLVPVNATAQTLYKGAINGEYLDLDDVDYVKAGEGVLVYGTPNTIYNFAAGSGSDDFTGNALKATATYTTSMENVFVLKGNAFLEYVGTNALAANKAFIQLPSAGPNNAPKRITMRFNGTTAVDNVEAESVKAEKFVENGQVYIRRGNEVYNLQGQKVNF